MLEIEGIDLCAIILHSGKQITLTDKCQTKSGTRIPQRNNMILNSANQITLNATREIEGLV